MKNLLTEIFTVAVTRDLFLKMIATSMGEGRVARAQNMKPTTDNIIYNPFLRHCKVFCIYRLLLKAGEKVNSYVEQFEIFTIISRTLIMTFSLFF